MLTHKSGLKRATPLQFSWDFADQDLNLIFFVKLGYLQKIYKNPTFWRYSLQNLLGQILQTHWLALLLNWSCVLLGVTIIAESGKWTFLNQNMKFFFFLLKISEVVRGISSFNYRIHNWRSKNIFRFDNFNRKSLNISMVVTHFIVVLQQCFEVMYGD